MLIKSSIVRIICVFQSLILYAIERLVKFVYINKCAICSVITNDTDIVCAKCWKNLIFVNRPFCIQCGKIFIVNTFENMICGWCLKHKPKYKYQRILIKFNPLVKRLIHAFKYYDMFHYGKYFANLIYIRYLKEIDFDFIIPTPMHKKRRIFRQYNQMQVLGDFLSKLSSRPMLTNILLKKTNTLRQSTLDKKSRLINLKNSFYVTSPSVIKDKVIILIDDVITTGSTVKECTEVLLKNGAKEVIVIAIAYV